MLQASLIKHRQVFFSKQRALLIKSPKLMNLSLWNFYHIFFTTIAIAHIKDFFKLWFLLFLLLQKMVKKNTFIFLFSKNVRHFVIFAKIKNRMICAITINILNLKPFDFFVSDNPFPKFHQQHTPIYFLRTYDSPTFSSIKSVQNKLKNLFMYCKSVFS